MANEWPLSDSYDRELGEAKRFMPVSQGSPTDRSIQNNSGLPQWPPAVAWQAERADGGPSQASGPFRDGRFVNCFTLTQGARHDPARLCRLFSVTRTTLPLQADGKRCPSRHHPGRLRSPPDGSGAGGLEVSRCLRSEAMPLPAAAIRSRNQEE